jgi:hypothetical protein
VLLIFLPVALVSGAIQVRINTVPVSFIVLPVSVVDIAVGVDKSALSIGFVFYPPALVERAVRPNLHSFALTNFLSHKPFAFIFRTVLERAFMLIFSATKSILLLAEIEVA